MVSECGCHALREAVYGSTRLDAGVAWAEMGAGGWVLVGVVAGAMLGFASAQLSDWIRRRRRGRAVARIIWAELFRNEALAAGAGQFGVETLPPVMPRFVFWETHAAVIAEVVHPDVLIDLEAAYGWSESLRTLVTQGRDWTGSDEELQEFVARIVAGIAAGRAAVKPYAERRRLRDYLGLDREAPTEESASELEAGPRR